MGRFYANGKDRPNLYQISRPIKFHILVAPDLNKISENPLLLFMIRLLFSYSMQIHFLIGHILKQHLNKIDTDVDKLIYWFLSNSKAPSSLFN